MPPAYGCHSSGAASDGKSNYVVVVDQGTMFPPGGSGTKLNEITDGTSITVCIVETDAGVAWAEPKDISLADLQTLTSSHAGNNINAGYVDGHVSTQPNVTPSQVIINDGQ